MTRTPPTGYSQQHGAGEDTGTGSGSGTNTGTNTGTSVCMCMCVCMCRYRCIFTRRFIYVEAQTQSQWRYKYKYTYRSIGTKGAKNNQVDASMLKKGIFRRFIHGWFRITALRRIPQGFSHSLYFTVCLNLSH